MAKFTPPQDVPSMYLDYWREIMTINQDKNEAKARVAYRNKRLQNYAGHPSQLQRFYRAKFRQCVDCFNIQTHDEGNEPPGIGPYDREWWYQEAGPSGLWYYDYFIQTTMYYYVRNQEPDWCYNKVAIDTWTSEAEPDENFGTYPQIYIGKIDEGNCYGFFKKTADWNKKLHLWYMGTIGGPSANTPFYLDGYEQNAFWQENVLTWNNQPAAGPKFGTHKDYALGGGTPPTEAHWVTIPVANASSIEIKFRCEQYGIAVFASAEYTDADKRPYWTG